MSTVTTEALPTRASVMDPETLAEMDATPLPHEFGHCDDCMCLLITLGDRARHLNIDGDCPRNLLSERGRRPGDVFEVLGRDGHLMEHHVHGLNPDGSPRVWSGGITHSPDCECVLDPVQWAVDHPERRLHSVKEEDPW